MNNIKRIIREYITSEESSKLMGEGLIKTQDPQKTVDLLKRFLGNVLDVIIDTPIEGSLGSIIVYLKEDFNHNKLETLLTLMNNMGYFVSSYFTQSGVASNKLEDLNGELYGVRFEPKFDVEYIPKQRYLYHITDGKHLPKILKQGLSPRTKSKALYHPERIYLTKNIDDAMKIKDIFVLSNLESDYGLKMLRVDLRNLFVFLMQDPQFDGGIYTTDNIPPSHIEEI